MNSNILLSNQDQTILAVVPDKQLLGQSLHLVAPERQFKKWSLQDHSDSYLLMQRIANTWRAYDFTNQYLIYGKVDSNPFHWEMVPYQKCRTFIGRIFQQLQVLTRTAFGGIKVSESEVKHQLKKYQLLLVKAPETVEPSDHLSIGDDSFCKDDIIERQLVMTGRKVNVLFNYAPIGFGGERLHFLVVPKHHRETFTDVTKEEYCESLELTGRLIDHFTRTRKTQNSVYLFNKTGIDAGQSVKHWHLHVIFSTNKAQDFWGKMTVIKNILLGSTPMKRDELVKTVGELREELAALKA